MISVWKRVSNSIGGNGCSTLFSCHIFSNMLWLVYHYTVLGQIRVITGKAQLLMRQKLKQYIGLVDTAENQSGERKTSAEDLQVSCLLGSFSM